MTATAVGAFWLGCAILTGFNQLGPAADPLRQRASLQALFAERQSALAAALGDITGTETFRRAIEAPLDRDGLSQALRRAVAHLPEVTGAFVFRGSDAPVFGVAPEAPVEPATTRSWAPIVQPAVAEARDSARRAGREPLVVTRAVVSDGRGLFTVAAVPVAGGVDEAAVKAGGPVVAAALRSVTEGDLAAIARRLDLPDLRYVAGLPGPETAAMPTSGPDGRVSGFLTWSTPALPPIGLGGAVVLAANILGGLGLTLFGWLGWRQAARLFGQSRPARRPLQPRFTDPLTGLANEDGLRHATAVEIARANRSGEGVAVLLLELGGFDEAVTQHGDDTGEDAQRRFGERAAGLMRGADTLARIEDGVFAIVQTGVKAPRDAQALARRIIDSMIEDIATAKASLRLGVSIGIALAPRDGRDPETLVAHARKALTRARLAGRYRHAFYDEGLDLADRQRKAIEDDLRAAILQDQLTLAYQPIYSAEGEQVVAVEALVRWKHPERGFVPPSDFIPIAEERGLIDALGEWVLRRACLDGKRWPTLSVAVNVSPVQFRRPAFVERVLQVVQETGFDPWRLELELTEGVVVDDAEAAEQAMMDLRATGIRFALDDFGTGYSSLIYLRRFAFDKIKIDKSFLDAMESTGESAILVHSVVHLGRALGLTVTAEGVETAEQHRFLQAAGCHQLQGYLFSKPILADEVDLLAGGPGEAARKVANA